jgi:hypothetical protein
MIMCTRPQTSSPPLPAQFGYDGVAVQFKSGERQVSGREFQVDKRFMSEVHPCDATIVIYISESRTQGSRMLFMTG